MRKLLVLVAAAAGALAALRMRKTAAEPDLWKQATQAPDLR